MEKLPALDTIRKSLSPGGVYRRSDFEDMTSNVDRNLATLVEEKVLRKLQNGLYLCPKKTPFGEAPPSENELLSKFLNDDHFVVYGPTMFNSLGLGTTQVYDKRIVFNRKRHGEMKLGDRTYFFHRWREAPKSLSKEFLLVEMVNRLKELAEDRDLILKNLQTKLHEFSSMKLYNALNRFGTKSTQKKLRPLLEKRI
ncbi:MAG: hypothetical protein KAG61_03060 [Bacteriovoracaceae bacterium]|nr:hypothetical protein [Bacteriovoracaceae bacterium]